MRYSLPLLLVWCFLLECAANLSGWGVASAGGAETPATTADRFPQQTLVSAGGARVSLPSLAGTNATVFVALSTQCPISNGYVPQLNRLAEKYGPLGVKLVALNANHSQSIREMAQHAREYKLAFPVLKDAGGETARQLGLTVCPQVCLVDDAGAVRYRGRIDDRYVRRGAAANPPQSNDLADALDAVLAGQSPAADQREAIGCPIQFAASPPVNADPIDAPTFNNQIVRILQANCQECHRSGGIGPLELVTYQQARDWAEDVRQLTGDRTMPPWKPVDGFGDFRDRRALSDEQIALLDRWVAAGCPEGKPSDLPPPAEFPERWRLGEPDLILAPDQSYQLAADGPDVYQCFVLPTGLDRDELVVALEVLPGNPRVVHHVIAYLDTTDAAERLDARYPGPGYVSSQGYPGFLPNGGLGGWAPGNRAGILPEGMAKPLPREAKVVMQVHYHKNGKTEIDQTRLGIHFAKKPITRAVFALPIMPPGGPLSGMKIPAGESDFEVRGAFVVPFDFLAVSATPHMHMLGKTMQVTAALPDGSSVPLIRVESWDFNWQEMYYYRQPLPLPAGTRLEMVAHFDNSAANPRNPNRPPRTVRWGEQTYDEMAIAFIEMAPQREATSADQLRLPTRAEALRFLFAGQTSNDGKDAEGSPLLDVLRKLSQ